MPDLPLDSPFVLSVFLSTADRAPSFAAPIHRDYICVPCLRLTVSWSRQEGLHSQYRIQQTEEKHTACSCVHADNDAKWQEGLEWDRHTESRGNQSISEPGSLK
jgi:hypothetical protein